MTPKTLYRKLVGSHTVVTLDEQNVLLFCDLHLMNGLKNWISFAMSVVSAGLFTLLGMVHWVPATIMMIGTIAGGYLGAPVARLLPRPVLRGLIAAVGFGMTAVFLIRLFQ